MMSDGEHSFIRVKPLNFRRKRYTRKARIVEGAYGPQDLLYARAEATYARQAVLLRTKC